MAAFEIRDVDATLGAPGWPLPGTLTVPRGAGRVPALVLLHDVGPHDRDGTVEACKPFRDLARGLAPRGVAVLRYDKRTRVHARRVGAIDDLTVDDEVLDDALAAVAALRLRKDVDHARIFVGGLGFGAMLAPRVVEEDPAVAGLVLLAPPARPLARVIVAQTEYLASLGGGDADAQEILLAQLQHDAELTLSEDLDENDENILGAPPSYWIDLRDYDAVEAAAELPPACRLFVAQGGRDYAVTGADFEAWKKGLARRKGVRFAHYPALDHHFVAGEGPSTPADVKTPGRQVDAALVDELAAWLREGAPPAR